MSGSMSKMTSRLPGYWSFRSLSFCDSMSVSYLSPAFGRRSVTLVPLPISSDSLRRITSITTGASSLFASVGPPPRGGMLSSWMVIFEKTADSSRKDTSTTMMFSRVVSSSSSDSGRFLFCIVVEVRNAGGRTGTHDHVHGLQRGDLEAGDDLARLGVEHQAESEHRH